jgi:hypothetical protein
MLLGYIRRHHIGLLALFVALGGTSYAAVKLPKNSVGTTQIKNHAVTTAKLSTTTVKALKGAKGDRGATGGTGATGATGAKGDPGAPATFSAAVAANSNTPGLAGGTNTGVPAASVTLKGDGKILVLVTGTFSATCGGGGGCTYKVGAKLDGTAVANVDTSVTSTAGNTVARPVALANIVSAGAGTHQITLSQDTTGANLTAGTLSDDTRVVAFAIG